MKDANWLNRAGYFFGVWVISMGGQVGMTSSGFSQLFVPDDMYLQVTYSGVIKTVVVFYTITMVGAAAYSLFKHFKSPE